MRNLLFDQLDLRSITLVCQDWGGLIGLRLVGEHPDRFARVVAANTFLPTGDRAPGAAFETWKKMSQELPQWSVLFGGTKEKPTSDAVKAAYDAPFPDETYKAGSRQFPLLVPASIDDPACAANLRAWEVLRKFDKPFLKAFSDGDPIAGGLADGFDVVPGTKGQPHTTIKGAGHFLQEDQGEELAPPTVGVAGHPHTYLSLRGLSDFDSPFELPIRGTYFLPWFDAGDDVKGFGAGLRPTWFANESGRGLYIAPYLRGVIVDDESITGASGRGLATGFFVGYAFGLTDRLDLRVGGGAQYIRAHVETDQGRSSFATPFVAIDAVLGYRL